jgi:hypothetical protein
MNHLTGPIPRTQWEWVDPAVLDRAAAFMVCLEAETAAGVIDLREPDLSQTADHS